MHSMAASRGQSPWPAVVAAKHFWMAGLRRPRHLCRHGDVAGPPVDYQENSRYPTHPPSVMAGLVPANYAPAVPRQMAGTGPAMTGMRFLAKGGAAAPV